MANNRFKRGYGTFNCIMCGKLTRDTNGNNGQLELCECCEYKCYYDNACSDYGNKSVEAADAKKEWEKRK